MAEKNGGDVTVIGSDTKIKGEMHFEGGARILGSVEGKICAGLQLEIGESAVCDAELEGGRIVIDGEVRGNVNAREQLTLTEHARVQGDLSAATLVVTEGATFIGHCRVGPDAAKLESQTPAKKAEPTITTTRAATTSPASSPATAPSAAAVETKRSSIDASKASADDDLTPPWRTGESSNGSTIAERAAS